MSDSHKLAVLAALFIFGCVASANYRRRTKVTTTCCTSVSKSRIPDKIISYTRQNAKGSCVDAIVFKTKNNGIFCTDPKARWVPKKLKGLNSDQFLSHTSENVRTVQHVDRRLNKGTTRCCTSVTKSNIPDEIISYTRQNATDSCVDAIIFQTKNNGKFCIDPNARWVPKKLKDRRLPKVTTTSVTSAIPEKKIRDEIISYTHQNASGPGVDAIIIAETIVRTMWKWALEWIQGFLPDRHPPKVTTRCCTSVTSAIPEKKIHDEIISYTRQNASGPCVDAILIQIKNNEKVCIDPNASWVPKILKGQNSDQVLSHTSENVRTVQHIVRRPPKVTTRCCKSVTSAIPRKIRNEIISYTRQNALGSCVDAIIFQTKNNAKVCTDPNAYWVPKKLKVLQKQS